MTLDLALSLLGDIGGPLRGCKQGALYGFRVRFAHSLVMAILFKKGDWPTKLRLVLRNAVIHARNLAVVSLVYKCCRSLLLTLISPPGTVREPPPGFVVLLSGLVAGALAFSRDDAVSEQVNLYILSRTVYALLKLIFSTLSGRPRAFFASPTFNRRLFGAIIWALALLFFEFRPALLHDSMRQSMEYVFDMPPTDDLPK